MRHLRGERRWLGYPSALCVLSRHHHSEWWDSGQAIEVPAGQGPPVGVPPAVSAAGAAASAAGSAARKLGAWARGDV